VINTLFILASSFSISLYCGREGRKSYSFLKPFHDDLKSKTQSSLYTLEKWVVGVNLNRLDELLMCILSRLTIIGWRPQTYFCK